MSTARRRALWLFALLLTVTSAGVVVANHYHGMSRSMAFHLRHATWGESLNLWRCIDYWMGTVELLRFDPAEGTYQIPPPSTGQKEACQMAFHRGEFAAAVQCLEEEVAVRGASEERFFWLGMAHLRQAEASNCLEHLTAEHLMAHGGALPSAGMFCSLPLERTHVLPESSRQALVLFRRLLDDYDGEDRLYHWLLAWSAMTLGTYPQDVPEKYRLPEAFMERFLGSGRAAMAERYGHLNFVDRALELGVATVDAGRGVAVEDFDRDGDLDLVTGGNFETVIYYENVRSDGGGHRFEERTVEMGLADIRQPTVITAADYDNDGWVDLFVSRPFDCYRLYRNEQGRFRDTTEESGLLALKRSAEERMVTWVSAWGDVDNDGDLDLFLAQWGFRLPFQRGLMDLPRRDSMLLENDGGRFRDITAAWGLLEMVRDQHYIGATFGDPDQDGDADLFLSSPLRGMSFLLENQGRRYVRSERFERGDPGFVAAFVDVDHDGRLDLFQSGFADARTSTEMAIFGEHLGRYKTGHSTLLMQREGRFVDHREFFSGEMPMGTMGASFGDLDNDGCHDFYLGTGNPESWFVLPNQMLIGRREGRRCTGAMDNISMLEGFGTIQKGHGIVFFDFDEDGDQDVYSALGGMWQSDAWPNQLFVNESALGHSWTKIRLRGRATNYFGVGARIRVVAMAADGGVIERFAQMDNRTSFGSAPYLAHLGLLDAVRIQAVEVAWPVSGCLARYPAVLQGMNVLDEAICETAKDLEDIG